MKKYIPKEGKAIKRRWIRKFIQKRRDEAWLPNTLTPHNIRRCYHTAFMYMNGNKKIAQMQLGDISEKVAFTHYDNPDNETRKKAIEEFYQKMKQIDHCETPFHQRDKPEYNENTPETNNKRKPKNFQDGDVAYA